MNGIEFLRWWYGDAIGHMEMTFIRPRELPPMKGSHIRTTWYDLPLEWARMAGEVRYFDELNAAGYGVYFGVTLHALQPPKVGDHATRPTDGTVCLSPGFWADLDVGGLDAVKREAAAQLAEFAPCPSAITDTGGGLHAYWKLTEPLLINNETDAAGLKATVRGLALALQSDTHVSNPSRVLRLPGYVNTKPERGQRCEVLSYSDDCYTLADFERYERAGIQARRDVYLGALPDDLRGKIDDFAKYYLEHGAPEGKRNRWLFSASVEFARARYPVEAVQDRLVQRAVADGLSDVEAARTVASAYQYAARNDKQPDLPPRLRNAYAARAALEEMERNE